MKDRLMDVFTAEQFTTCRDYINQENRIAIHLFSIIGLPLSVTNIAAQFVVAGAGITMFNGIWMALYFIWLAIYDRFFLPDDYPQSTRMLYILELPVMALAVLLGTVWDPDHQALTILMFMIALPAFILDRPQRSLGVTLIWCAAFVAVCSFAKPKELVFVDTVHIAEFFVASCGVTLVVVRIRLDSIKNLEEAKYNLEHDRQTGCLSRYALEQARSGYYGRPILLLMGDLDQFTLYNDFYGHKVGDAISRYFTETLMEVFGSDRSYRYGGDEMLCVMPEGDEEDCLSKMEQCQELLKHFSFDDIRISLSCAFGYVTGVPNTSKDFREMIQLADIYTHKAKAGGEGGIYGTAYDQEHMREGLVQANSSHARSYEMNHLTGLPVMSYFVARADELLTHVADMERGPVMGYFKLKNMRNFNSEFGYAQGDRLLADTAKTLLNAFDQRRVCSITSGQFGILCYVDEVEPAMKTIADALKGYKPGYNVDFKAGFCPYTGQETAISLMDKARIAQKSISGRKDVNWCFYTSRLDEETHFRQYVINHVDEAIEKGYLQVYYQPIARTVTGQVCNEEALSRWIDPAYGYLMPFRFIPALEENGLMYKVNLNVVRQVLDDCRHRLELGVPVVPVSVNLSRRDFEQCDMVEAIAELVDDSGFPRSILKIEITESAFVDNQELIKRAVERFRAAGFEVWMDDFGSEYSTLNLLQEVDFDLIKIDMHFMKNMSPGSKNFIIVSDILDMAKRMGITTLVEGVETQEQYALMQTLGCEKIQGFLFNKPNPPEYIIDRALKKTGLSFEPADAAPYFEAVGRIDLNAPMTLSNSDSQVMISNAVPTGIIERRDGRVRCLRGNESFIPVLEDAGVLEPAKTGERFRTFADPMPPEFEDASKRCQQSGGWISFTRQSGGQDTVSVFLRRVTSHTYNGGTAMIMVILK